MKGVVWSALHTWGTRALQLGVMLVLARLLEPRDFGLFAMAQVVLLLTQPIAEQGIPEALVQRDRSDPDAWSTGFLAILASCLGAALLILLTAGPLALVFRSPALEPILRWLSPILVVQGIHSFLYAHLRAGLDFASQAGAGIAGAVVAGIAGVAAAVSGLGVWSLVITAYSGVLVETLLLFRVTGRVAVTGFDTVIYRELLGFGRFIVAGGITTFLHRRTDDYFVGLFLGAEILGIYSIAYRVLEVTTTVSLRAVERVAFPVFAKLQARPELMSDAIRTSFRFTSLVTFPMFVGLVLVAHDLVLVALGPRWLPAVTPIRILSVSGIALCATNVLPSVLRAVGLPQRALAIGAVTGVILTGAFAMAAQWSLDAVAWVFTIGVYAVFPFFYVAVRRTVPISIGAYLSEAVRPLLATTVMAVVVLLAGSFLHPLAPPARLGLEVAIGSASYALVLLIFARGLLGELQQRLGRFRHGDGDADG